MSEFKRSNFVNVPNRRKVLLINPPFQYKFLSYMLIFSVVITIVMYSSSYYFFHEFANKGRELGLPENHLFFTFLARQHTSMNIILIVSSSLATLGLLLGGLYLSHRIVGPIHRLKQHMQNLSSIDFDGDEGRKLKFREKDYFQEVTEIYNNHIEKIKTIYEEK